MEAQLQYGRGDLAVEIPSSDVTVLTPKHEKGLPAASGFAAARRESEQRSQRRSHN